MKVSIIIRTKNEEKWIASCLKAIFNQSFKDFEVILVDNNSTDKTVEKAKAFDIKILEIDHFLPGKAINHGIKNSSGEILVMISGHCIPVNSHWLENLIQDIDQEKVAGIYGRQQPLSFSTDADKRDLTLVFGLDKKIQRKDPFFHNANSAIKRSVWEKIPFDEDVTNIEDRVWGKEVLKQGYEIVYEPEASVYHYHGIHQDGNEERCRNVVRILESLNDDEQRGILNLEDLNAVALIPIKGEPQYINGVPLMKYTIEHALESKYISKVIVATDNNITAEVAVQCGAEVPFMRPEELSEDFVGINMVAQYSLNKLEEMNIIPDIICILEVTYPFRTKGFVDHMIYELIHGGFDSCLPARLENKSVWIKNEEVTTLLGQGFMPRGLRDEQLYVSLFGLGMCTYPHLVREGEIIGKKLGIVEVNNAYSQIEVRSQESSIIAEKLLATFDSTQDISHTKAKLQLN